MSSPPEQKGKQAQKGPGTCSGAHSEAGKQIRPEGCLLTQPRAPSHARLWSGLQKAPGCPGLLGSAQGRAACRSPVSTATTVLRLGQLQNFHIKEELRGGI